jgi:hypothetical protein
MTAQVLGGRGQASGVTGDEPDSPSFGGQGIRDRQADTPDSLVMSARLPRRPKSISGSLWHSKRPLPPLWEVRESRASRVAVGKDTGRHESGTGVRDEVRW